MGAWTDLIAEPHLVVQEHESAPFNVRISPGAKLGKVVVDSALVPSRLEAIESHLVSSSCRWISKTAGMNLSQLNTNVMACAQKFCAPTALQIPIDMCVTMRTRVLRGNTDLTITIYVLCIIFL
jgi:hypothetical protein